MADIERGTSIDVQSGVVVFSKNKKLVNEIKHALEEHTFGTNTSYFVEQSDEAYESYKTSAASVLDLDLVENDFDQAAVFIHKIKPADTKHALFVVGDKEVLKRFKSIPSVNKRVSRTFAKPVMGPQVILALGLVREQANSSASAAPTGANYKPAAFGAVGLLAVSVFALLAWFNTNDDSTLPSIEAAQIQTQQRIESLNNELPLSDSATNLLASAEAAIQRGQILQPADGSALSFYRQLLDIDRFGERAEQRKQRVLADIKLHFLVASGELRFGEAGEILQLLREVAPFHEELPSLETSLAASIQSRRDQERQQQSAEPAEQIENSQSANEKLNNGRLVVNSRVVEKTAGRSKGANSDDIEVSQETGSAAVIKSAPSSAPERIQPATVVNKPQKVQTVEPVSEPVLLTRVEAKYPRRALKLDIQGWVELSYQVDQAGKPINIEVVDESPKKIFTKSAKSALEQWQYQPRPNAQPAPNGSDTLTTKFNFSIDS